MGKNCARWAKPGFACLIAIATMMSARAGGLVLAQSSDPSALPRLALSDVMYVGGFRLPAQSANGDTFEFGGKQLTYNPAANTLFVGSRGGRVAEVTIPSPVQTSNAAAMPFASYRQPFFDPTEGNLSHVAGDGVTLDSLLVYGDRLYGTVSVFYDALNAQRVSHYSHSLQLNEPSFSGWSQVWEPGKTGFVSGTMSLIPSEWRGLLGGAAATGQCCIPVVSRTSYGPAAFAFNPADIGQPAVGAAPLLYYTGDHPTLGPWNASSPVYGSTTAMGGMAIIASTRTALYFGRNGLGPVCYGVGTGNQTLHGKPTPDGTYYCYDPTSDDKGTHAYPYRYQIWAYDLNDFAAVKAGKKQPWDVMPYAVWPLELPTAEKTVRLGGVGYDAERQLLYVSQMYADSDGYAFRPVIHTFQINAAGGSADAPAPPPPPPADDTTTFVSSLSLAVNRNSPQVVGTAITFTAQASGGVTPLEYKWLIDDGNGWQSVTGWSTIDSFTWTPGAANDRYRVGVWARSSGNSQDKAEASASSAFVITVPPGVPVQAVTLSADKTAPQFVGTSITFSATPTGGSSPVEYKWFLYDGSPRWQPLTGWSTSPKFVWTPTAANANWGIRVWARANGATKEEPQAQAETLFPIQTPPPVVVRSVTLAANKAAPQMRGTPITLTAASSGGVSPVQYKFLLYDGSPTWQPLTGWTTSPAFTWTPSAGNSDYAIRVWARGNGSTRDEPEAEAEIRFPITAPYTGPVSAVKLTTDRVAPQPAGTLIIATATVMGGVAPYEFRWLIHDGVSWKPVTGWTTSNKYGWKPTAPNASHFIGVWVRSAGSTREEPEATMSLPFGIR